MCLSIKNWWLFLELQTVIELGLNVKMEPRRVACNSPEIPWKKCAYCLPPGECQFAITYCSRLKMDLNCLVARPRRLFKTNHFRLSKLFFHDLSMCTTWIYNSNHQSTLMNFFECNTTQATSKRPLIYFVIANWFSNYLTICLSHSWQEINFFLPSHFTFTFWGLSWEPSLRKR